MKKFILITLSIAFTILSGRNISAQSFEITKLPDSWDIGDILYRGNMVSADGSTVYGAAFVPIENTSTQEAFYWNSNEGLVRIGQLADLGNRSYSIPKAATGNGKVIVGESRSEEEWDPENEFITTRQVYDGFRWSKDAGMVALDRGGFGSGETHFKFLIGGISGNGQVIYGKYRITGSLNFDDNYIIWTPEANELIKPAGCNVLNLRAISYDGSTLVGQSYYYDVDKFQSSKYEATIWNGTTPDRLGYLPGHNQSIANDVSGDGEIVVGNSLLYDQNQQLTVEQSAFMYKEKDGVLEMTSLQPDGYSYSFANLISDDGKWIFGGGRDAEGNYPRLVWDVETGNYEDLQIWFLNHYAFGFDNWISTIKIRSFSRDLRSFVIDGTYMGERAIYRLQFTGPQIVHPKADTLWIAGEKHAIEWTGPDSVHILLARNGVFEDDTLVTDLVASDNKWEWDIPDTLLSRKLQIYIENANDPNDADYSENFRVKNYELTRINLNGEYERWDPQKHAWKFVNRKSDMWPNAEYINYKSDIDKYTGQKYPAEWVNGPINAKSSDFLSWSLFADLLGENQVYFIDGSIKRYKPSAVSFWANVKDKWGGSCFGFALSNFWAFEDSASFFNKFSKEISPDNLRNFNLASNTRKPINLLWGWNFDYKLQIYRKTIRKSVSPIKVLGALKADFLNDNTKTHYTLYLGNNQGSGAHAVNPYKIEDHESNPDIQWIYVFDNNKPNNFNSRIAVDTKRDWWTYFNLPTWGGEKLLYFDPAIDFYFRNPNFGFSESGSFYKTHSVLDDTSFISIYINTGLETEITSPAGKSIGYRDSTVFNNLESGIPIIPVTGYEHPPVGYFLEENNYSASISNSNDSLIRFSVQKEAGLDNFFRKDGQPDQTDKFIIGKGLMALNPDENNKTINLQLIRTTEDQEQVVDIQNTILQKDDSLAVNFEQDEPINIINYGSSKSYDLKLKTVSAAKELLFEHKNIPLDNNASHIIDPKWDELQNESLKILIDCDGNGIANDSLIVDNTVSLLRHNESLVSNMPKDFKLYQNYPNPFNPVTKIEYQLPKNSYVKLSVYDIRGRKVKTLIDGQKPAGYHQVLFDGTGLTSGIYFYRIHTGEFNDIRRMLLLK